MLKENIKVKMYEDSTIERGVFTIHELVVIWYKLYRDEKLDLFKITYRDHDVFIREHRINEFTNEFDTLDFIGTEEDIRFQIAEINKIEDIKVGE